MSPTSSRLAALAASLLLTAAVHAAESHAGELVGPGTISTGLQETSVALTPDGDTLYFMRSDLAEADDRYLEVAHRLSPYPRIGSPERNLHQHNCGAGRWKRGYLAKEARHDAH